MTRVLIVEDNPVNLDLAEQILEDFYEIFTAINGSEALKVLATHLPDLVLMDLAMPVLDGWATLAEMKKDPRLKSIPVIAVSAHAHQTVIDLALKQGFRSFVTKPLDEDVLLAVMRSVLADTNQPTP